MADFNVRSDSVDVEQIMTQIRARIQEKRGVDYTEEQVRELATVRLEKFLDPKNLRSDLLEQFRQSRPPVTPIPEPEPIKVPEIEAPYEFKVDTLYHSHRGYLRWLRRLLSPLFKLFWNANTLTNVLQTQATFNVDMLKRDVRRRVEFQQGMSELTRQGAIFERSRNEWNMLYYEVLHNLVVETTRNAIELKNMRMRMEALASRLDFSERRVRALEGVVQYRPEAVARHDRQRPAADVDEAGAAARGDEAASNASLTPSESRRRRRRRRGRRPGGLPPDGAGHADSASSSEPRESAQDDFGGDDGDGDSSADPDPQ